MLLRMGDFFSTILSLFLKNLVALQDGPPVWMKKMMKIERMSAYFAASPSGKMILFTKKKITIEMPPLSTVVPML